MRRQTVRVVTTTRQTIFYSERESSGMHCRECGHAVETIAAEELVRLTALTGEWSGHSIPTPGGASRICCESLSKAMRGAK